MRENIRLSFQGIFSHKMRSFLTMLGIIIGIAAIIAIVSTIKGTNEQIKNNLVGSGNNLVRVSTNQGGMDVYPGTYSGVDFSNIPVLTDSDMDNIKAIPSVEDAAKFHLQNVYDGITANNQQLTGAMVVGGDNKIMDLEGYEVARGRKFIDSDFEKFRNVVIIDSNTAQTLFEGKEALNGTIEIQGVPFIVVGVIQKVDEFQPDVENIQDFMTYYGTTSTSFLLIPDSSWPVVYGYDQPYQVDVKAHSTEEMSDAGKKTESYLNSLIPNAESAMGASAEEGSENAQVKYKCADTLQKAKELQKLATATNSQLIWIASISLLVGGIGVMNIMLVSVTERTREIGLKKALGARRGVILGQFLTEAAVLTSIGGILGVGGGIGLAFLIAKIAEVPVAISVPAILVSVAFSMLIGIIFGLLPSIKASKLDPIEALRFE